MVTKHGNELQCLISRLLIIGISGIVFSLFSLVLHGKTRKLPKPEPIRFKGVATKLVANKLFILLTIAQALKGIATVEIPRNELILSVDSIFLYFGYIWEGFQKNSLMQS